MDIPSAGIGKLVTEGHIYFFSDDCPVGVQGHMHVCIKHHKRYLIFSTCSSQLTTALRLAQIRGYNINTYPVVQPDVLNGFSQPTYINCNQVWELDEEQFGDLFKAGQIRNTQSDGCLDDVDMKRISNGIKLSTEVPDNIKELF